MRWLVLFLFLLFPKDATGERSLLTIGGPGGKSWAQTAHLSVALDDTSILGSIQPRELKPWENIFVGEEPLVNIFGFNWHPRKIAMEVYGRVLGLNPRIWYGASGVISPEVIDGDETTSVILTQLVPAEEYARLATQVYGGWEMGVRILENELYTIDLGIVTPVNRIVFFPPQEGIDRRGVPNKDNAPQGYEVSVALHPREFLIYGSEVRPWHTLDHVLERTLVNSRSIVEITFPTESIRFIRLNFSLMPQFYTLAEIEAYGEGFPPSTRYVSGVVDFGEPVNFGRIFYAFKKLRRGDDGDLYEDPDAPVRLVLETKSGLDDSHMTYYIVGEFGENKEVTQKQYERANPVRIDRPSLRLPGMQSAITEDLEDWSPWSSPYAGSGEEIRSPDGRRYVQFRFAIESEDVFAFGRLDSVAFEYSPLLAREVLGEVSLLEEPEPPGDIMEIPAGVEQVFAYDLRATFDTSDQSGFDGIRMDVPPGTRFLKLEMGEPLAEVEPDSVRATRDEMWIYFPSHKVVDNGQLVRVTFGAMVLTSSTYFTGDIFDTGSDNLPQSIEPGDATDLVSTNAIRVFASQPSLDVLSSLEIVPSVLTPNGDDRNDRTNISFDILGVEEARLEIHIYNLSGRRVRELLSERRGMGRYEDTWDGTDDDDVRVLPGIYLCKVAVHTDSGDFERVKVLSVVY